MVDGGVLPAFGVARRVVLLRSSSPSARVWRAAVVPGAGGGGVLGAPTLSVQPEWGVVAAGEDAAVPVVVTIAAGADPCRYDGAAVEITMACVDAAAAAAAAAADDVAAAVCALLPDGLPSAAAATLSGSVSSFPLPLPPPPAAGTLVVSAAAAVATATATAACTRPAVAAAGGRTGRGGGATQRRLQHVPPPALPAEPPPPPTAAVVCVDAVFSVLPAEAAAEAEQPAWLPDAACPAALLPPEPAAPPAAAREDEMEAARRVFVTEAVEGVVREGLWSARVAAALRALPSVPPPHFSQLVGGVRVAPSPPPSPTAPDGGDADGEAGDPMAAYRRRRCEFMERSLHEYDADAAAAAQAQATLAAPEFLEAASRLLDAISRAAVAAAFPPS